MSPVSLDYRQLRQQYAPHVRVCQRCDTHLDRKETLAWQERLCPACLKSCGLSQQAEAARKRLLPHLRRRIVALSQPAD